MRPIPRQPNLPTPTNCFGKPQPVAQWYECPHCKKESPLKREWVGLTQQDIDIAFDDTQEGGGFDDFARAIEAKLREKNA